MGTLFALGTRIVRQHPCGNVCYILNTITMQISINTRANRYSAKKKTRKKQVIGECASYKCLYIYTYRYTAIRRLRRNIIIITETGKHIRTMAAGNYRSDTTKQKKKKLHRLRFRRCILWTKILLTLLDEKRRVWRVYEAMLYRYAQ